MKRIVFSIIFLFLLAPAFAAKAEQGFVFNQKIGASLNGLGLAFDTSILYRIPLSESGELLWESMKLDIGVKNSLTPSENRAFLFINIEPIAFFDLTFQIGAAGMYKLFGYGFTDLPGPRTLLTNNLLNSFPQQDKAVFYMKLSPEFKVRFGPVIAVNTLDFITFNAGSEDRYYYVRKEAIIMKYADSCFQNNTYLLYDFSNGWFAGLNYYMIWNIATALGTQYLAGLGSYDWKISPALTVNFTALAGWYTYCGYAQYLTNLPYLAVQAGLTWKL